MFQFLSFQKTGMISVQDSLLNMESCVFTENMEIDTNIEVEEGVIGLITIKSHSNSLINDCLFRQNNGTLITVVDSELYMNGTSVDRNTPGKNNIMLNNINSQVNIQYSDFSLNVLDAQTSLIQSVSNGAVFNISHSTFRENKFSEDSNVKLGNIIYMNLGTLLLSFTNFTSNESILGGAVTYKCTPELHVGGQPQYHASNNEVNHFYLPRAVQSRLPAGINPQFNHTVMYIDSCFFIENKADMGGALSVECDQEQWVWIVNCVFDANEGEYGGGAIYAYSLETLASNDAYIMYIIDCIFQNNVNNRFGGIVETFVPTSLTTTVFQNNCAYTGTLRISDNKRTNSYGHNSIIDCEFYENYATFGGGIYINSTAYPTAISNCNFQNNNSSSGGGFFIANGDVSIEESTFIGNNATIGGGGYCAEGVDLALEAIYFANNTATKKGGALYSQGSTISLLNSVVYQCSAVDAGGVYLVKTSRFTVVDCLFTENEAANYGGALIVSGNSTASFESSLFANNTAERGGGLIFEGSSVVTITNATIVQNTAQIFGGGILLNEYSAVTITSSRLNNNIAVTSTGKYISHSPPFPSLLFYSLLFHSFSLLLSRHSPNLLYYLLPSYLLFLFTLLPPFSPLYAPQSLFHF